MKPLPPIPLGSLTYPLERRSRAFPALSPARAALGRVPLGRPPSLHPLRRRLPGFVRELHRYYGAVRLPAFVHLRITSSDFPLRPAGPHPPANAGSPGSRSWCLHACSGPQTARGPSEPHEIGSSGIAFRLAEERRHPGMAGLHGSIPGPHARLSTLHLGPHEPRRMTRLRDGFVLSFPGGTCTHHTTPVSPAHSAAC